MSGSAAAVAATQETTETAATEVKVEKVESPAAEAKPAETKQGEPAAAAKAAEVKSPEAEKKDPATKADLAKAEEKKPDEGENKPEVKPEPKPSAPEKYELKVPEGSLLKAENVVGIEAYAKGKALSNDTAQAILDHQHHEHAAFQQRRDGWLEELRADKDVGGEALAKNAELAKRVVDKYASESFKKTLNETGLGNNPDLFRMLVRVGKAAGEDVLDLPRSHVSGNQNDHAQVLYGKK